MKQLIFLLFAFIFCLCVQAQEHYIQVTFSEPMNRTDLFDINNWLITDARGNEVAINKIGIAEGDSIAVLYTHFLAYKTHYTVSILPTVRDSSGNAMDTTHTQANFNFNGYDPMQHRPYLIIKK